MEINKIVLRNSSGEITAMDLTQDTAVENTVLEGHTFHKADGERVTGTHTESQPNLQFKQVELTVNNSTTSITADEGYDGLSEVEVTTNIDIPQPSVGSGYFDNNGVYEITPGLGIVGWSRVEVNVQSGGADRLPSLINRSITSVSASDFVNLDSVRPYTFMDCSLLTSVELPDTIQYINAYAFTNCRSLVNINFPINLREISYSAFDSTRLTNINIPDNTYYIEDNAFDYCECDYITVGSNNATFDSRDNCNALIRTSEDKLIKGSTHTVIPNTVISMNARAFAHVSIINIQIPGSITAIPIGCFAYCENLQEVEVMEGVQQIFDESFIGCHNLTAVNLPSSITYIGAVAFHNDASLTTLNLKTTTPPQLGSNVFKYWNDQTQQDEILTNLTIYVPSASLSAYQQDANWSEYASIIQADPNN